MIEFMPFAKPGGADHGWLKAKLISMFVRRSHTRAIGAAAACGSGTIRDRARRTTASRPIAPNMEIIT